MKLQMWIRVFANEIRNPTYSVALSKALIDGWRVVNMITNNCENAYTDFILEKE